MMTTDGMKKLTNQRSNTIPFSFGRVFQLIPGVQCYEWGMKSADCKVAQFAASTKQLELTREEGKPYAELWMGTHASLPSKIVGASGCSSSYPRLSCYLKQNADLIGSGVGSKFWEQDSGSLPFLLKVLSIGKALSIQAHPCKELGRKLHETRPEVYKDGNHKPEMVIALTRFSGLCGFRPLEEIVGFLKTVAEFREVVGLTWEELDEASEVKEEGEMKEVLKTIFGNLMRSKKEVYEREAEKISSRLRCCCGEVEEEERQVLLRLAEEFPLDIGIFCTFVLNIVHLEPGEGLFLGANEPHAYLEGEIVECMASSDNVVRGGLTGKLRDVETLVEMCTYSCGKGRGRMSVSRWEKSTGGGKAELYDARIEEFSVVVCELEGKEGQKHEGVKGPSILLALEGEGRIGFEGGSVEVGEGQVFFIGALTLIEVEGRMKFVRAFVEA